MQKQRLFVNKFYKRCSHSYEKPSMVDRGIQVYLFIVYWKNSLRYLTEHREIITSKNCQYSTCLLRPVRAKHSIC